MRTKKLLGINLESENRIEWPTTVMDRSPIRSTHKRIFLIR